jgi:hypothetical protein
MRLGRKKVKCTVGPAQNPATMEFFFHSNHWSLFSPKVKGILEKGLKPCRWEEKTVNSMEILWGQAWED